MSIVAQYTFRGRDLGLLGIAFPQTPIFKSPFSPFVPNKRVIVISEDDPFHWYREKEVIQIISTAEIQLDCKDGFLRFLGQSGVRATHDQIKQLLDMEDEQFWPEAKTAAFLKYFPNIPKVFVPNEHSTVLDIFEYLFEDFEAVYRHYHRLKPRITPGALVSVLMSMMLKTDDPDKVSGSRRYRRVLRKNQRYLRHFQRAFLQCEDNGMPFDHTMTDLQFLGFAAEASEHTRPDAYHLPGDVTLENLDIHIKIGL